MLKQRYSDFLVNEVDQAGRVVHLVNTRPPAQADRGGEEGKNANMNRKRETTNAKPTAAAVAEVGEKVAVEVRAIGVFLAKRC